MALSVTHAFVSALADNQVDAAAGKVLPSHWNAALVATQATARILGRVTAGAGAIEELTAAQVKTLLAITAGDVSGLFSGAYADLTGKPTLGTAAAAATTDFLAAAGTAVLATALATPRAINGVNFDGTAAITVAAAAGTLTGTTLAANVTASSLTSAAGGSFGSAAFTAAAAYEVAGAAAALSATLAAVAFSGAYSDLTGAPAAGATLGANTFTALQTILQAIAATSTDGVALATSAVATVGAQKWSPRVRWTGSGWKTDATAAAQTVDWIAELQPVQGSSAPTSNLVFASQINGGGYTTRFYGNSAGQLVTVTNGASLGIIVSGQNFVGIGRNGSVGGLDLYPDGTTATVNLTPQGFKATSTAYYGWSTSNVTQTTDLLLTRSAAAVLQQGAANAASPVAQTLQAQGSRAGTDSNVGGANYTQQCGTGTGTGTLASWICKTPIAVASGSDAQTMTESFRATNGTFILPSSTVANLPVASTVPYGQRFVTDSLAAPVYNAAAVGGGAVQALVWSNGTTWLYG